MYYVPMFISPIGISYSTYLKVILFLRLGRLSKHLHFLRIFYPQAHCRYLPMFFKG